MVLPRQKTTAKNHAVKDKNSLNILDISSSNYYRPGMKERKFRVGDLVHEQHFPERKGVVTKVIYNAFAPHSSLVIVNWAGNNPNAHINPEKIEERYIVLLSRRGK